MRSGRLTRRAEDLLPLLKIMAGPDGDGSAGASAWSSAIRPRLARRSSRHTDPGQLAQADVGRSARRPRACRRRARLGRRARPPRSLPAGARRCCHSWPRCRTPAPTRLAITALLREAGEARTSLPSLLFGQGNHTLPTRLTVLAEALPAQGPTPGRACLSRARDLADRAGRRDRRRRCAASGASHGRAPAPAHIRPAVGTDSRGGLQPGRRAGHRGAARAQPRTGCRWASRSQRPLAPTTLSIAIALELEAVFGGWVPPG